MNQAAKTSTDDRVEYESRLAFQPTLVRLLDVIGAAGMTVFITIDHAAGASNAGFSMPPTVLILYGHARAGTPVMLADPGLALDLPLRALLREDSEGRVSLSFHPIAPRLEGRGVAPDLIARLVAAQRVLLEGLAPRPS